MKFGAVDILGGNVIRRHVAFMKAIHAAPSNFLLTKPLPCVGTPTVAS